MRQADLHRHSFSQYPGWTNFLFLLYRRRSLFLPSRVLPANKTKLKTKVLFRDCTGSVGCRERETNPKLSPGVPHDPVLGLVLRHSPTSHRDDVIGQRQRVKLWEDPSAVFLQALGGHQGTTERENAGFLKSFNLLFLFFSHYCYHWLVAISNRNSFFFAFSSSWNIISELTTDKNVLKPNLQVLQQSAMISSSKGYQSQNFVK